MTQAGAAVDIDVTAHRHRAEAAALADQGLGTVHHWRRARHRGLLHRQPLTQAVHRLMRVPAVADKALVQMDVAVDQPGQDCEALQVDAFRSVGRRGLTIEATDAAATDVEMQWRAVAVYTAMDELKRHRKLPESQVMAPSCALALPSANEISGCHTFIRTMNAAATAARSHAVHTPERVP
jgi:hypothetical protein